MATGMRSGYDYIVCGAGSAGCVVASRLSEDPAVQVLLIEAGPDNDDPKFSSLDRYYANLRGDDWGYTASPAAELNERRFRVPMGKAIGGGSAINNMVWAQGYKKDYDAWAEISGDQAWGYESVLATYRKIENWQGNPDVRHRGTGGPMWIEPPRDPSPLALAMMAAAEEVGIPGIDDHNGRVTETGEGGCALSNMTIKDGRRYGVAHAYLGAARKRPNLHIMVGTEVRRVLLENERAVGVEVVRNGEVQHIRASGEVILSLGALHSPHVLMRSGVGNADELAAAGIEAVHHLPGVGQNFQDHVLVLTCLWESPVPVPIRNNAHECVFFWKSEPSLEVPDLQPSIFERSFATDANIARYGPLPEYAWGIAPGLDRPLSKGRLHLVRDGSDTRIEVETGYFTEEKDIAALTRCIEIIREMGNSSHFRDFVKREIMPGPLKGEKMLRFIRDGAASYGHASCTCSMGRGDMAVVDAKLRVHGIRGLRVADGSVMPVITTGNIMAPIVMIGEKAAQFISGQSC